MEKIHQAPHSPAPHPPKREKPKGNEFHPERSLLQQQGQQEDSNETVSRPPSGNTSTHVSKRQAGQQIYSAQENDQSAIKSFSSLKNARGSEEDSGRSSTLMFLLFFLLLGGISLDIVEIISEAFDLTIVVGILLRLVMLPIEALYVLLFAFVCWKEDIPQEEKNVANLIRGVAMLFQGVELSANFFPPGLSLIEILPLKTLSVIMIFFLRPLIKKIAPNIPGGERALATTKQIASKIPGPKKIGK